MMGTWGARRYLWHRYRRWACGDGGPLKGLQLVALLRRFEDTQDSGSGAPAARILDCPDGLWTIEQQAVAQLPGTRRHKDGG